MASNPYKKINLQPTRRDLLGFGAVLLGGAVAFALACRFLWHRPDAVLPLLLVGVLATVLAQVPVLGRLLYIGWMALGVTMGLVTSPIFMAVIYLVLFVPLGLVFRLIGRDALRQRLDPKAESYWEEYPQVDEPLRYLRQY
jgi:hypothetical protein